MEAPDLAGHGSASVLTSYSVYEIAEELATRIQNHYDIVVGASFGGPIALVLVQLTGMRPSRMVLCDPVLDADLTPYTWDRIESMAMARLTIPSECELMEMNPQWEQEDAVIKRQNAMKVDPNAVRDLFKVSLEVRRANLDRRTRSAVTVEADS